MAFVLLCFQLHMFKKAIQKYLNNFTGFSREIWILAIITFINRAGTMVLPFLSKYLKEDLGFSYSQVGWIMVSFGFGSMLGSWLGGKLSDKIGFYKVMVFSLFTSGLMFFGLQKITSFEGLMVAIFLIMVVADMFRPAMFVSLAAYAKPENRTRALTLVRLAINLGFAAGPALGGLIIMNIGYEGLFWIDGASCIIAILIFWYLVKEKQKSSYLNKDQPGEILTASVFRDGPFWIFLTACLITGILFFQLFTTLPLYHKEQFDLTEFQENILNGINPADISIRYFETELSGELTNEILTPTNYINTAYPQNIYVQVTRNQSPNCNAFTSFALQVNLNPMPVLAQDLPICMDSQTNQATTTVTLNAGLPMATHDFIWEWNGVVLTNEIRNILVAQAPGTYQVTAINKGTLCEGIANTTIIPYFKPQASVSYLTSPFTGKGSVEIVSENSVSYTYSLDEAPEQTSPLFENLEAGTHQIVVTDINGCGTQILTVVITDYMRYFTPNGDGYNEEWKVLGLEEHQEAEVYIFDRHGKLIKGMRANEQWNGTLNGYALPSNDYWFTVQYTDNGKSIVYKSHFTLKR